MRRLIAAVLAGAVILAPGVAMAAPGDPEETTAAELTTEPIVETTTAAVPTTTSAAPTTTLLDLVELVFGDGALAGCCGTQPTPQASPGYVPPANTLTPPPSAAGGRVYTTPSYRPGTVVAGGGSAGPTSVAAQTTTPRTDVTQLLPPPAMDANPTCVPDSLRGQPGYEVALDPDGNGISCETPIDRSYFEAAANEPPRIGADDGPPVVALALAALALGVLLAFAARKPAAAVVRTAAVKRTRGRHRR